MSRKRNEPVVAVAEPSLAHDGCGVVRHNERVYFVPGVLPEEEVLFTPFHKQRGRYAGRLDELRAKSAQRVAPPCEYFGVCGGCATQHLSSAAQLAFKDQTLRDNLQRIGHVMPEQWLQPVSGESLHYRRKARLGVKHVPKKGGILVGFREKGSAYLTSLQACLTLDQRLSDLLPALHELIENLSCKERIPQIEVAAGDAQLALVMRNLEPMTSADITHIEAFAKQSSVQFFMQPAGPDSIYPLWPQSPEPLFFELPEFDLRLEFRPSDFIQVNAQMNQRIVSEAITHLELSPADKVLDLFCGLGNFSLAIARSAGEVLGIEAEQSMVLQAAHNAQLNNISNASFQAADLYLDGVESTLPQSGYNKMLIDPPRSGALAIVQEYVPLLQPQRIVYVSCNPATLARDADILVNQHGYALTHAGAFDMFPHTAHVESMAVFEKLS